ncbi:hypothetical protein PHMEG_0006608 [Phytophthora megakarya]|uniref:Uncharacterized protein n=1 Tax=Phytophthora megakarya TaxID=4795 RepID=A0A225WNR5_9STRA|nr:hypothetical protein PHMEG_0006608 [Phytophthora megakarya]
MTKDVTFLALELSLSLKLRVTFKVEAHFEADDGVKPDCIHRELTNRVHKPNQTVAKQVDQLVRRLRQANVEIAYYDHTRLLLSNTLNVFGEMAQQHTMWCSKNDCAILTRSDAK